MESWDEIKKKYSEKRNGFYFLKNKCMKNALRVYCDFNSENKVLYYYNGGLLINDKQEMEE